MEVISSSQTSRYHSRTSCCQEWVKQRCLLPCCQSSTCVCRGVDALLFQAPRWPEGQEVRYSFASESARLSRRLQQDSFETNRAVRTQFRERHSKTGVVKAWSKSLREAGASTCRERHVLAGNCHER